MKKVISLILIFICIPALILSCDNPKSNDDSSIKLDENGNYSGFSDLPSNYTVEDAKEDGCFVMQDLEVVANNNVWENFIETSLRKENTCIRIALFYTESSDSPFFLDLYFEDGYYYLFDSSSENLGKQPYKCLLTLEGKFGDPKKDSCVVVLTDDDALTFDSVMRAMLSSNMGYIKSISPFRLVMFK